MAKHVIILGVFNFYFYWFAPGWWFGSLLVIAANRRSSSSSVFYWISHRQTVRFHCCPFTHDLT